jgi:hypothetical protein
VLVEILIRILAVVVRLVIEELRRRRQLQLQGRRRRQR